MDAKTDDIIIFLLACPLPVILASIDHPFVLTEAAYIGCGVDGRPERALYRGVEVYHARSVHSRTCVRYEDEMAHAEQNGTTWTMQVRV